METKELIEALRNEDETDVSAMMAYMEMAADRLEGMQRRLCEMESAVPTLLKSEVSVEPWSHSVTVRALVEWQGKTTVLVIPVPMEAVR